MAIITGTANGETLAGTAGNDAITGKGGDDVAPMGAGDDVFVWNPGDGSDKVNGQGGFDTLRFTGSADSETFNLTANAGWARISRDIDSALVALNDVERISLRALAGFDFITINDLAGTDVQQVAIDLAGTVGGVVGDGVADSISCYGAIGNDTINVALLNDRVSVTGLSAQVAVSHADANDILSIASLGGNDIINASALNAGTMQLNLGGDDGNDRLTGSKGNDFLFGDVGNDTVIGGAGEDIVDLGAGNDLFVWNPGNGSDVIEGRAGFDTLRFNGSSADESIVIAPNGGRALLSRNVGAVLLDINDIERLQVNALGGADKITVGDLTGTAVTQVAIDLAAKAGGTLADNKVDVVAVNGTAGDDSVDISWSVGKIVTTGLPASVSVAHAGATDVLAINGGSGNDMIVASGMFAGKASLQLLGGAGNDAISGSAGADAVRGGDGNDVALLGAGNDVFFWNPGDDNDIVEGQDGFDTLQFTCANVAEDIVVAAVGERVQLSRDISAVSMDLDGVERIRLQALGGVDTIEVDNLAGTDVKQVAIDLAGSVAGASDSQIDYVIPFGTAGNDQVAVAASGGVVSVTGLPAQVTVAHADAFDQLVIYGREGNDTVNAVALPAGTMQLVLVGDDGNDTLTGSAGNDVLGGGNDNDFVRGGGGSDILTGGSGNDRVEGGAGSDEMFGAEGNDVLLGGLGNDLLDGGFGNDTMTGGAGNDTMQYTNILDGQDVVLGFDGNAMGGQDVLDLDALFDNLLVAAVDRAGRVSIVDSGATVNVFVNADGNAGNGFEVTVALRTLDTITIGQDVIVGS